MRWLDEAIRQGSSVAAMRDELRLEGAVAVRIQSFNVKVVGGALPAGSQRGREAAHGPARLGARGDPGASEARSRRARGRSPVGRPCPARGAVRRGRGNRLVGRREHSAIRDRVPRHGRPQASLGHPWRTVATRRTEGRADVPPWGGFSPDIGNYDDDVAAARVAVPFLPSRHVDARKHQNLREERGRGCLNAVEVIGSETRRALSDS
jgi:hypothetical protein